MGQDVKPIVEATIVENDVFDHANRDGLHVYYLLLVGTSDCL